MKTYTRTRMAVAAALMALLSITTVGAVAGSANGAASSLRGGDHWPN